MYTIMYETSCQSRFDARYWMLGAGALGRLPFGPRSQASLQKAQGPGVCKLPKPPALSQGAQGRLWRKSRWVSQRVWDETLKPTWRKPALLFLLLLAEEILMLRMQLTIYYTRFHELYSELRSVLRAVLMVPHSTGYFRI